jgi:GxxExxY protein
MDKKPIKKDLLYPELSYRIMSAVFEVHNQLGPGFTEDIYENALAMELELQGIPFERQKQIQVFYKGRFVGNYRLDIVIDEKIILELKAVSALNEIFRAQIDSYLYATGLQLGILINFGSKRVQSDRIPNIPGYSPADPDQKKVQP